MKQLNSLYSIVQYCRADGSEGEQLMIDKHIKPLGVTTDKYGNLYKRIGNAPIIWSSHTDTVHNLTAPTKQVAYVDNQLNPTKLFKTDDMCLGADCGTGIWLMIQMIQANVEGLYIFHRAEEIGGLGSDYIRTKRAKLLGEYKQAIAFDRFGTDSVITHQGMSRCASDNYGLALSDLLGMEYSLDTGGSFTDTANYTSIIPECTNISVGYYKQHSANEWQDLLHLMQLREVLCSKGHKFADLPIERDPSVSDFDYDERYEYGYSSNLYDSPLYQAIADYPDVVAQLLQQSGYVDERELTHLIQDTAYSTYY